MFIIRLVPGYDDDSTWLVSEEPLSEEELRAKLIQVRTEVDEYIEFWQRTSADEEAASGEEPKSPWATWPKSPWEIEEEALEKLGLRNLCPDLQVGIEESGYYGSPCETCWEREAWCVCEKT